jgi:hypothetical protein
MAESNLRALLASARGSNVRSDAPVGDAEMAAILGVLKGDEDQNGDTEDGIEPSERVDSDILEAEPEAVEPSDAPAAG